MKRIVGIALLSLFTLQCKTGSKGESIASANASNAETASASTESGQLEASTDGLERIIIVSDGSENPVQQPTSSQAQKLGLIDEQTGEYIAGGVIAGTFAIALIAILTRGHHEPQARAPRQIPEEVHTTAKIEDPIIPVQQSKSKPNVYKIKLVKDKPGANKELEVEFISSETPITKEMLAQQDGNFVLIKAVDNNLSKIQIDKIYNKIFDRIFIAYPVAYKSSKNKNSFLTKIDDNYILIERSEAGSDFIGIKATKYEYLPSIEAANKQGYVSASTTTRITEINRYLNNNLAEIKLEGKNITEARYKKTEGEIFHIEITYSMSKDKFNTATAYFKLKPLAENKALIDSNGKGPSEYSQIVQCDKFGNEL